MSTLMMTGAGGVLGRALIEQLNTNRGKELFDKIFLITTDPSKWDLPDRYEIVKEDLLREDCAGGLMKRCRPEKLVHLAWDQTTEDYKNSDRNQDWLNASTRLLYAFAENGGRQFLFASSKAVYDGKSGRMRETDADPRRAGTPASAYGRAKLSFEKAAAEFLREMQNQKTSGEQEPLVISLPRFFTIYGPGDRHSYGAIPSAFERMMRYQEVYVRTPLAKMDYVYSMDAAKCILDMLESETGGCVNIGTGEPLRMKDVFTDAAKQLGLEMLLEFSDSKDKPLMSADTGRMEALGLFCPTSFEKGIRETAKWYKKNAEGKK